MNPCNIPTAKEKRLLKRLKIYKKWRKIGRKILIKVRSQKKIDLYLNLSSKVKARLEKMNEMSILEKLGFEGEIGNFDLSLQQQKIYQSAMKIQKMWRGILARRVIDAGCLSPNYVFVDASAKKKMNKQEKASKGNSRLNNIMRITEKQLKKLLLETIANNPYTLLAKQCGEHEDETYPSPTIAAINDRNEDYLTECYDEFLKDYQPPKKAKSAGGKKKGKTATTAFTPYADEGCRARSFGGRRCCKATSNGGGGGGELCGLHQNRPSTMGVIGAPITDKLRNSMKKSKKRLLNAKDYGDLFMSKARWKVQEGEEWVAANLNFAEDDFDKYFFAGDEEFQEAKAKYLAGGAANEFQEEEKVSATAALHKEEKNDGNACICMDENRDDEDFYHFWECIHVVHKDCGLKWRNLKGKKKADWQSCHICKSKPLKRMKKVSGEQSKFQ